MTARAAGVAAAPRATGGRVLVAGIGNVFLGDDGFGVAVVDRIDPDLLPDRVDVADYGIRGVHLAYDLLEGDYDTIVIVDAVPVDGPPGTLAVLEVDVNAEPPADGGDDGDAGRVRLADRPPGAPGFDAHSLDPQSVLALLDDLGGSPRHALVVGCRPAALEEGMGLSEPVAAAVDGAARLVTQLVREDTAREDTAGDDTAPASAGERRNAR